MSGELFVSLVAAYSLGAIPFALLTGRVFFGVDLREHGSKNLGATNVFRVLGPWPAIAVMVLDMGKGTLALLAAELLTQGIGTSGLILVMIAAVVGHSFSPFARMKGGKGIATSGGCLFYLMPKVALILLAVWFGLIVLTRMVSVGSVGAAVAFPGLVALFYPQQWVLLVFAMVAAIFIIAKHKSNILRIRDGTENTISFKRAA